MAKKVVKKVETWYSNDGREACGELDALTTDFRKALCDASELTCGLDEDIPLTSDLRAAIVALNKFAERAPKPVKPRKSSRKKKLKLEVGKSYRDGQNDIVKIVSRIVPDDLREDDFEFGGDNGEYYRADGSWALREDLENGFQDQLALVAEA